MATNRFVRQSLVRDGKAEPLVLGEDAFFTTLVGGETTVEAPLVFLGYGVTVPELHHDDFAGVELKGKIAVTVEGLPGRLDGPLVPYYLGLARRWKTFRDAGVVGWIVLADPTQRWHSLVAGWRAPSTWLTGDEFDDSKGERIHMWFNPAHAEKLFAGTGHTAAELFALAHDYKPLPRFALPVGIRATTRMRKKPVESSNVIARLEGSDPRLRNEYVVLSAHLDHLGVGEPVNGDSIYNGAIDNASGVAVLLEMATEMKRAGVRPKRSVLFAFFTAEETSLLGSLYFVTHPTVPRSGIVADLNVDNVQVYVPLRALLVLGAEESDLGDAARRAAAAHDAGMDVDLEPRMNRFTCCSDQGNFVERGIPAVKVNVGFPGELNAVQQQWRRERYHKPSDDLQQPINLESIVKYEEILWQFLLDVANDPRRPQWKAGSFYKRYEAM